MIKIDMPLDLEFDGIEIHPISDILCETVFFKDGKWIIRKFSDPHEPRLNVSGTIHGRLI